MQIENTESERGVLRQESVLRLTTGVSSATFDPTRVTQISWHPRAFIYKGFLTDEECDHLIHLATGKLKKSMVADYEPGKSIESEVRTSYGMFLKKAQALDFYQDYRPVCATDVISYQQMVGKDRVYDFMTGLDGDYDQHHRQGPRSRIQCANRPIPSIQVRFFGGRMTTSMAIVAFQSFEFEKKLRSTINEVLAVLKEIQEYRDEDDTRKITDNVGVIGGRNYSVGREYYVGMMRIMTPPVVGVLISTQRSPPLPSPECDEVVLLKNQMVASNGFYG
ncbi:procollagen-proline 4-dioxygenase [Sarracenia purpurea var. burkii]